MSHTPSCTQAIPAAVTTARSVRERRSAVPHRLIASLLALWAAASAADSTLAILDEVGTPLEHVVVWPLANAPDTAAQITDTTLKPDNTGTSRAEVDQLNKRFAPYISVVAPGTQVFFPNSDDIRHHVYSFSSGNAFERKLYRANEAEPVRLDNPGVVALGCNIHDNMQAYILVTDDAVLLTGESGEVSVPDGSGRVAVWHPALGEDPLQVSLKELESTASNRYLLRLPFTWTDPQAPRSGAQLESLLKQFSRDPR